MYVDWLLLELSCVVDVQMSSILHWNNISSSDVEVEIVSFARKLLELSY